MKRLCPGLCLLLLGGCVHPSAVPAPTVMPRQDAFVAQPPGTNGEAVPEHWWRLYGDPVLDAHIERTLAANTDIRAAMGNLRAARALAQQAASGKWPQTVIESGAGPDKADTQPSTSSVPKTSYELGFTVAYEVDLSGRAEAAGRATAADAEAAAMDYQALRISLVADTISAYADMCAAARDIDLARDEIRVATRHRDLMQTQAGLGETSGLERARAEQALETARGSLPLAGAARRKALLTLAALQGLEPAQAGRIDSDCRALPEITRLLPVGDAAGLLARRPDVRAAGHRLAAATHQTDVVVADLYPRIRIGGSAGQIGGGFDAILTPLITWSFPNRSVQRAKISEAKGKAGAALAHFDGTILQALRETESALEDYRAETARSQSAGAAFDQAERAVARAEARFRLGEDSYLPVLDAEAARNKAQKDLTVSHLAVVRGQIALFRALGGGWQDMGASASVPDPHRQ